MIVLIIAEKNHLDSLPMPEDDVELRVRGIWVFASVVLTTISSIIIFTGTFLILQLFDICKRILLKKKN